MTLPREEQRGSDRLGCGGIAGMTDGLDPTALSGDTRQAAAPLAHAQLHTIWT